MGMFAEKLVITPKENLARRRVSVGKKLDAQFVTTWECCLTGVRKVKIADYKKTLGWGWSAQMSRNAERLVDFLVDFKVDENSISSDLGLQKSLLLSKCLVLTALNQISVT